MHASEGLRGMRSVRGLWTGPAGEETLSLVALRAVWWWKQRMDYMMDQGDGDSRSRPLILKA